MALVVMTTRQPEAPKLGGMNPAKNPESSAARSGAVLFAALVMAGTAILGLMAWALSTESTIDTSNEIAMRASIEAAELELTPAERQGFRKALYVHAYASRLHEMSLDHALAMPAPGAAQLWGIKGKTAREVMRSAQEVYALAHGVRLLEAQTAVQAMEVRMLTVKQGLAALGDTGTKGPIRMTAIDNGGLASARLSFVFQNGTRKVLKEAVLKWRMYAPGATGPVAVGDIVLRPEGYLAPGGTIPIEHRIHGFTASAVAKSITPAAIYKVDVAKLTLADGDEMDLASLWTALPPEPDQELARLRAHYEAVRKEVPTL